MKASAMPCLRTAVLCLFLTSSLASSCTPRRICGDAGISFRDCVAKGCCWDGTIGVSGPRCFRKRIDKEACTAPKNLDPCRPGEERRKSDCEAAFGKFPCNDMYVWEEESTSEATGERIASKEVHKTVVKFEEEPADGFGEVVMEVEEGLRYRPKPNVPVTETQTMEKIGTITEQKGLESTMSAPITITVVEVEGREAFGSLPDTDRSDVKAMVSEEQEEGMEETETQEIEPKESEGASQTGTFTERLKRVRGKSEVHAYTPEAAIHYVFEHGRYRTPAGSSTSEDTLTDEQQLPDEEFAMASQAALDEESAMDSQISLEESVPESQIALEESVPESQIDLGGFAIESQIALEEESAFGSAESPEESQLLESQSTQSQKESQLTQTQSAKLVEPPLIKTQSAKAPEEPQSETRPAEAPKEPAQMTKIDMEQHADHLAALIQPCILAKEASVDRKMSPAMREKDFDDLEEPWIAGFIAFGSVGAPEPMDAFEIEIETAAASKVIPEIFDEQGDVSKTPPQAVPSEIAVPEMSAEPDTSVEPEGIVQALQGKNPDAEEQAESKPGSQSETQTESKSEATHEITFEDSKTTETEPDQQEQPSIEGPLAEEVEIMEPEQQDSTVEVFGYVPDHSHQSDTKHNTTEHSQLLKTTQPIESTQILTKVANSLPLAGDLLSTSFTKPTADLTDIDMELAPADQAKTKFKSREAEARQFLTGSSTHCTVYRRIPCGNGIMSEGDCKARGCCWLPGSYFIQEGCYLAQSRVPAIIVS